MEMNYLVLLRDDENGFFSIVHLLQNIHISIASILEREHKNWIQEVNAFFFVQNNHIQEAIWSAPF